MKTIVKDLQLKIARIEELLTERKNGAMNERHAAAYCDWSHSAFKAIRLSGCGPIHFHPTRNKVIRYLKSDLDEWLQAARDKSAAQHEARIAAIAKAEGIS